MKKKNSKNELPFEDFEYSEGDKFLNHVSKNSPIYLGISLLFLFVFSISSLFGLAGSLGGNYFSFITEKLGTFSYPLPILYLYLSFMFLQRKVHTLININTVIFIILVFTIFVLISFLDLSGEFGEKISSALKNSIGTIPTIFLLIISAILSVAKIFETSLEDIFNKNFSFKNVVTKVEKEIEKEVEDVQTNIQTFAKSEKTFLGNFFSGFFASKKKAEEMPLLPPGEEFDPNAEYEEIEEIVPSDNSDDNDVRSQMYHAVKIDMPKEEKEVRTVKKLIKKELPAEEEVAVKTKKENQEKIKVATADYKRPPASIYASDAGKASAGDNKENARIIKRTLSDFGISVEMDEVTVGPTVTRYALKPAQGVKIEKIMNLANNIALELGVSSVSISRVMERSLIGIEVPNKQKSKLGLGSLLDKKEFLDRPERLTVAIGKDIYGDAVFSDMAKMPHLLIAGTTGSGKSSLMHVLINSLIFKNSPYDLKFIMIDPKKVEFALYNNLPHLYTPVIKDPKKAIQTLNWLVQEMDRRYQILEDIGKQNINAYHAYVTDKYNKSIARGTELTDKLPEKMPYIVLVIDELADFMMKYPKEMESGIVKLAQMSRAVGIHLILATQRPSTNVITGVIKGNIPSRVALRVASQVDSRVIIDQGGAEKLLGYGDLLFVSSDGSDTKRIQSPFVQEDEIKEAVAYLRRTYDDVVVEDLKTSDGNVVGATNLNSSGGNGPVSDSSFAEDDDKYEDAKQVVLQTKKTSISNLQVRLGTGYARSAKLINMLEQAGVIVTVTDNSGKQVKVVSGQQIADNGKNEELERKADEMLEENDAEEMIEKKESSSFFKF